MPGQAGELVRLGDGRLGRRRGTAPSGRRARSRVLRIAGQRRHPQRAAPRQRRDVAHDRIGRILRRQHSRQVERRSRLTIGQCAGASARRSPRRQALQSAAQRRGHLGGRSAHLQGRNRRQPGGLTGAERASQRVGGGGRTRRDAAVAEGVGAPFEGVAASYLDHQVRSRASSPSATGSAPRGTRARRSSPCRAERRWPAAPWDAAASFASHWSGRTQGTAATCQRRRLLDGVPLAKPQASTSSTARVLSGLPSRPATSTTRRCVATRRNGRLERRDPAAGCRQPDRPRPRSARARWRIARSAGAMRSARRRLSGSDGPDAGTHQCHAIGSPAPTRARIAATW